MKTSTEARAIELGEYIVECGATVRNAAKKFGISKSTVHTVVTKWNGSAGGWSRGGLHHTNPYKSRIPSENRRDSAFHKIFVVF